MKRFPRMVFLGLFLFLAQNSYGQGLSCREVYVQSQQLVVRASAGQAQHFQSDLIQVRSGERLRDLSIVDANMQSKYHWLNSRIEAELTAQAILSQLKAGYGPDVSNWSRGEILSNLRSASVRTEFSSMDLNDMETLNRMLIRDYFQAHPDRSEVEIWSDAAGISVTLSPSGQIAEINMAGAVAPGIYKVTAQYYKNGTTTMRESIFTVE